MQDEERLERFVLMLKSTDLALNELVHMAGECLSDEEQKNLRRNVAEFWVYGMNIRNIISKSASESFKKRIRQLYPEDRD